MKKGNRAGPIPAMYGAPNAKDPAIAELLTMHTYARPAGSKHEAEFCARYLDSIPGMRTDTEGNRIITVGNSPRVMWSSHTDTVHKASGRSKVTYGAGILALSPGDPASCLGADCSAGVWIMRRMILRNVPGLYVFHAAEEVGGFGSEHIAKHSPGVLRGIDHAIALDRYGTTSIITHQAGGRCCSGDFAEALAYQLGKNFHQDSGGTFTDTANYTSLIPECTNLSVGYYGAHSAEESLDVGFAAHLLERLCALDASKLPVLRVPQKYDDFEFAPYNTTSYSTYGGCDLVEMVAQYPNLAAEMLRDYGITEDDFEDLIRNSRRGRYR